MNLINRHNYEEFFLLYVDNELSSEDRRLVEDFIELHPDLKEELELLSQFRLTPDEGIVFENKEELLKITNETPSLVNNYEESLLSYIDNELTAPERIAVEQLVNTHPDAKKELEWLQRTKLQPETIAFPHKESLYRQEEKVRAMPFRWWRAAAAVLILALGLTAVLIFSNKSANEEPVAKTPGTEQKIPGTEKTSQPAKEALAATDSANQPVINTDTDTNNEKLATAPANKTPNTYVAVTNKETKTNNSSVNPVPVKKEEPAVIAEANKKASNNLPTPENNPYVTGEYPVVAKVSTPNEKTEIKNIPAVTNQPAPSSDIIQARYTNNDEELVQNDGKKNKLRGLFRKAARTFEKRTDIDPTDDNRLLVGGFAIKLK